MTKSKRLLLYKILVALFAVLLVMLPAAKNTVPEIDMRVLVTVIGLDQTDNGLKASAEIMIPMAEGEGQLKQEVVSAEGLTISEALDKLNIAMGRRVELGHCGMIVVGHKLSEEGVLPHLKYLLSSGKISAGVNVVTTEKISAAEFIEKANNLSEASSSGVNNFIEYSNQGAHVSTITLLKFLNCSYCESGAIYMPCIEIQEKLTEEEQSKTDGSEKSEGGKQQEKQDGSEKDSGGEKGQGEGGQSGGSGEGGGGGSQGSQNPGGEGGGSGGGGGKSGGGSSAQQSEIKSVESVVIFKDGKRVKKLDKEPTRGITWVDNKSDKGLILLEDVDIEGQHLGPISGQIKNKKIKMKTGFADGMPEVTFKLTVAIQLDDRHRLTEFWRENGMNDEIIYKELRADFREKIRGEIEAGINEMRETNCDIVAMKTNFNRFKHKQYKAYKESRPNDFLTDLKVKYDIKIKLH